jgi:hypothetical protein
MSKEIECRLARLDGYLNAVRAFCGRIREFEGSAFLLRATSSDRALEVMLNDFFLPHASYTFTSNEEQVGGLRDLENGICPYLVVNLLGIDEVMIDIQKVVDRQKYISFRIMDLVREVIGKPLVSVSVFKIVGGISLDDISSVFFCVQMDSGYLVLHFIDDAKRLKLSPRVDGTRLG